MDFEVVASEMKGLMLGLYGELGFALPGYFSWPA